LKPISTAVILVFVLALAGVWATTTSADVGQTIINLCKEHRSIAGFTFADYQRALRDMATDLGEYTECEELVAHAEQAAATAKTGIAPAGSVTPSEHRLVPSTSEQRAIRRASLAPGRVHIDGHVLVPGVAHVNIASAVNDLPTPLLATVVLLFGSVLLAVGRGLVDVVRRSRSWL
jgi:hypothetical protein